MKAGSQLLPVGAVLTSILSLQFGAAFATTLFSQIGPAGATTLRLTIAAIILGVIVRPRWSRWSNRQRKGIFALGIALAVMNGAFYLALDTVPIGTAVTIEFLGPLTLAAILSRRWADGAWVLLAFGGVLLLGLSDHGESGLDPIGVMFALIAATAWAGYIVAGSHLAATLPSADGLAGASIVAAVLTLPFGVVSGGSELLDPTMLAAGAAVAVLSSVIPVQLGNVGAALSSQESLCRPHRPRTRSGRTGRSPRDRANARRVHTRGHRTGGDRGRRHSRHESKTHSEVVQVPSEHVIPTHRRTHDQPDHRHRSR